MPNCIPKWLHHCTAPQQCRKVPVFHILVSTCSCQFFKNSCYNHPSGYEVVSYCGLDLHFPHDQWRGASFHVHVSHVYIFFQQNISSNASFFSLPIFRSGLLAFRCIVRVLHLFWMQVPYQMHGFKRFFSHYLCCLFIFLMSPNPVLL